MASRTSSSSSISQPRHSPSSMSHPRSSAPAIRSGNGGVGTGEGAPTRAKAHGRVMKRPFTGARSRVPGQHGTVDPRVQTKGDQGSSRGQHGTVDPRVQTKGDQGSSRGQHGTMDPRMQAPADSIASRIRSRSRLVAYWKKRAMPSAPPAGVVPSRASSHSAVGFRRVCQRLATPPPRTRETTWQRAQGATYHLWQRAQGATYHLWQRAQGARVRVREEADGWQWGMTNHVTRWSGMGEGGQGGGGRGRGARQSPADVRRVGRGHGAWLRRPSSRSASRARHLRIGGGHPTPPPRWRIRATPSSCRSQTFRSAARTKGGRGRSGEIEAAQGSSREIKGDQGRSREAQMEAQWGKAR